MLTTYDRYLLGRFASVFGIFFVAALGLYTVVDGFMRLDDFQSSAETVGELLALMGQYYFYQSFMIFDMLGPTLAVVGTMAVLAMGLKFGEIHPLLAAGVRGHRVCLPLVIGVLTVGGMLTVNREFVFPRIANRLQGGVAAVAEDELRSEPAYDPLGIFITGDSLQPTTRSLHNAEFRLPAPEIVSDYVTLKAEEATYVPPAGSEDGGWLLSGLNYEPDSLPLTELGRGVLIPQHKPPHEGKLFLLTPVSFEELCDRSRSFQTMSTPDLIRRIRATPPNDSMAATQIVHLHDRFAGQLLSVIGVMLAGPLIVRKERWSIVANMAMAAFVIGAVYAVSQGLQSLGRAGLLAADVSVWLPLMIGGGVAAWYAGEMRT